MDFIENLVSFFKKPEKETKNKSPEGTCPVCWGYQEYDSKIRKIFKDKQIDVNNHQDSYMIVKKFVVEHIDGIHLKKGKTEPCPTCGSASEPESDTAT